MSRDNRRHCYCHFTFIHGRPNWTLQKKSCKVSFLSETSYASIQYPNQTTLLPLLANHPGRCPLATGNPSDPSGKLPTTMAAANCGTRASNNFIGPTRRSARLEWEMARQQKRWGYIFGGDTYWLIVMKAVWRCILMVNGSGTTRSEESCFSCIWSIWGPFVERSV